MMQKSESLKVNTKHVWNKMLALIRMSLWGGDEPPVFVTPDIYQELVIHGIASLPAPILLKVDMHSELRQKWIKTINQYRGQYVKYCYIQETLPVKAPYAILKGTSAAMYYPYPEYRTMGDIDIMTRREDFSIAYNQLLDDGYCIVKQLEREVGLAKDGIAIELHRYFAKLNDPDQAAFLDDLIIDNINPSHVLPDFVNGLVLLEHIGQHMENGLGLRQIIDWMMFVDKCLQDEQWTKFKEMSDSIELTTLAIVTTHMCEMYLGLPERSWSSAADTELCDQFMQYVLDCGNFGNKWTDNKDISEYVFSFAKTPKAAFKLLQERGLINWKASQQYQFLRPFAWIYQAGRYAVRGLNRENAVQNLKEEYESATRRDAMLEALGVRRRRKGETVFRDGKYVKE